jgi:dolichol-phosphate mannosyltransferase
MKLSVLIPVYNEEACVADVIRAVAAMPLGMRASADATPSTLPTPVEKEIIVVDDCSTDRTPQILAEMQQQVPGLRILRHEVNKGKGAGIRTAMAAATGDALIIQDADLEYSPKDIPALLAPIAEGKAKVVYGVRSFTGQKLHLRLGNIMLTWLTNLVYGIHVHDMETGYKLIGVEVARRLTIECKRFDMEPEITAKITRLGYRICELPISYAPREAKKLSPWRDGWPAVKAIFKYRTWKG